MVKIKLKKKEVATKMIKVKPSVYTKVAIKVIKDGGTIGGFYDEAAIEKLTQKSLSESGSEHSKY